MSRNAARYYFRFLLERGDPDALAQRLLEIGRGRYGATAAKLTGAKLRRWAAGTAIVPRWAYTAALDLCVELGYRPRTLADWMAVIATRLDEGADAEACIARLDQEFNIPASLRTNILALVQQQTAAKHDS